jgi:Protein of unknown function (DUF3606)
MNETKGLKRFDVSKDRLTNAIATVGPMVKVVEREAKEKVATCSPIMI